MQGQTSAQDQDYAQQKAAWVKEHAQALSSQRTAATSPLATQSSGSGYLQSSYIKCYINSYGEFNIGTVDNDNLTYNFPNGCTSEVLVRIDGQDYFLSDCVSSTEIADDQNVAVSTAAIEGVKVEQIVSLVKSPGNNTLNMVSIKIKCTNQSDSAKKIGVRIMLDTMLGSNDGAPFIVSGRQITTETSYPSLIVPRYYQALDSLYDPNNTATGYFFYSTDEMPDLVQFAHWGSVRGEAWDYQTDPNRSITGDSAVVSYFNEQRVAPGGEKTAVTYFGAHSSAGADIYDPFSYSNSTYEHQLAIDCARYSALAYQDYQYLAGSDVYYDDKDSGKKDTKENNRSKVLEDKLKKDNFHNPKGFNYNSPSENSATFTLAHKKVNHQGKVRDLLLVVIRGTNKAEWRGNMCVTGTSYRNLSYHQSFFTGATMIESQIEKYVGKYDMNQPLVLITGHSRGGAVGNILARELTSQNSGGEERLDCVDPNGIYAYLFAVPNVQTDYATMLNIYNFCFRDDFVPSMPLYTKWGYFKSGRSYSATADWATAENDQFSYRTTISMQSSLGFNKRKNGAEFDASATKNVILYVAKKWTSIKDYYDKKIKKGTADSLFDFMYNTIAPAAQPGLDGKLGTLGSATLGNLTGTDCGYIANFFFQGRNTYINDTHQMCNYYNALVTGVFEEVAPEESTYCITLPPGVTMLSAGTAGKVVASGASAAGLAPQSVDEAEQAALVAFADQGSNADLLQEYGWDLEDPATWEGVTFDDTGHVADITLACMGLQGTLDLSEFSHLASVDVSYNQLSALVLPSAQSSVLANLACSGNRLTALNIEGQPLVSLTCTDNYLDTSAVEALKSAWANIVQAAASGDTNQEPCASIEPQSAPEGTPYAAADLEALKTILNNDEIWDTSAQADPAQWLGVTWELVNGELRATALDLDDCGLKGALDVSALTELVDLSCAGNELTQIDASSCTKLAFLNANDNQLTQLNLANGAQLQHLSVAGNLLDEQTLQQVSADVLNADAQGVDADASAFDQEEIALLADIAQQRGYDAQKPGTWGFVTWTAADGVYHAQELRLSAGGTNVDENGSEQPGFDLEGKLDLSAFSYLTSVDCAETSVAEVVLPNSMTNVDEGAFYDCSELAKVTLPEALRSIGEGAFNGCASLGVLELPAGIESIGADAFAECGQLQYVVAPDSLNQIGEGAFKLCSDLNAVYFTGDAPECGQDAFMYAAPGFCIYHSDDAQGWDAEDWATYSVETLQNLTVTKAPEKLTYDLGESFDPYGMELLLFDGSKLSVLTDGYDVDAPATFEEPGFVQLTVSAGDYTAPVVVQVRKRAIYNADAWIDGSFTTTGSAIKPKPKVTYQGTPLVEGRDYKLSYYNNVSSGWATCVVEGIGSFEGTLEVEFYIAYRPGTPNKVVSSATALASAHEYDNRIDYLWQFKPAASGVKSISLVFDSRCHLESGCDNLYFYDAAGNQLGCYTDKELAGKTLTFKTSSLFVRFVTDGSVTEWGFAVTGCYYNGVIPQAPGKAKISKVSRLKKGFTVKIKKVSGATGYQVRYSTKKSMKSPTVRTTTKLKTKVKKLKAKKAYYVQVRAYKNTTMGVKYGAWSAKKRVKTK